MRRKLGEKRGRDLLNNDFLKTELAINFLEFPLIISHQAFKSPILLVHSVCFGAEVF